MTQKAILVLGMHRSGTSALASGLSALGVYVEQDDNTNKDENPKGYYEDWEAVALNDVILESKGLFWSNPFVGEIKWDDSDFNEFTPQISAILLKKYSDKPIWAIKDPRLCLVLPLWTRAIQQTLDCEIYHIHAIRNPIEVAHSLQARRKASKKFYCGDIKQSVLLWFFYNYTSVINSINDNNLFISFEGVINNSENTLKTIARFLNVKCNTERIEQYSSSFIEIKLQHHFFKKEDLRQHCFGLDFIADFYEKLLSAADSIPSQSTIENILKSIPEIAQVFSCSRVASPVFQEVYRNNAHLFYITQKIQQKLENGVATENKLMSLPDIYGLWQGQTDELRSALEKREDEMYHLLAKQSEQQKIINTLQEKVKESHELEKYLKKKSGNRSYIINQISKVKYFFDNIVCNKIKFLKKLFANYTNNPAVVHKRVSSFVHFLRTRKKNSKSSTTNISIIGCTKNPLYISNKFIEYLKLKRQLKKQNIFDTAYYCQQSQNFFFTNYFPVVHYVFTGAEDGLDPNYIFDSTWYLDTYTDVKDEGKNPLLHFLVHGDSESKNPGPAFWTSWYKTKYTDIKKSGVSALTHYLIHGSKEHRDPNPYFWTTWYLKAYPSVLSSSLTPYEYFLKYGANEKQNPNPLFDTNWYTSKYAIDNTVNLNPLIHFILKQDSKPTNPNPYFKSDWYLDSYPEVKQSGYHAIQHYIEFGYKEGTNPNPYFNTIWYANQCNGVDFENTTPLLHYIKQGWKKGLHPSPKFDSTWYYNEYLSVTDVPIDPLLHYLNNENSLCYDVSQHPFRQRSIIPIQPHYINLAEEENLNQHFYKESRIAIHIHFDTIDLLDDVTNRLNNINYNYDLLVSVYGEENLNNVRVYLHKNLSAIKIIGIDSINSQNTSLITLLEKYAQLIGNYDVFGHFSIHGSNSDDNITQSTLSSLDTLLGTSSSPSHRVSYIDKLLKNGAKVISDGNYSFDIPDRSGWSTYYPLGKLILNHYTDVKIEEHTIVDFPLHSMFWAKPKSLSTFLSLPINDIINKYSLTAPKSKNQLNEVLLRLIFISAHSSKGNIVHLFQNTNYLTDYRYYESQRNYKSSIMHKDIKILSYYLPQFHPIPENDEWHGKGFTEWTNVIKTNPLFRGHYQQHIPHSDLGYYYLNSPDVLKKQAAQMEKAGVCGQVFYHYWFSGKLILESTAQMLLDNTDIKMPFCFCWANENWTRRWDGNDDDILLEQVYSAEDALAFIRYLIPFFKDSRYIKVNLRPMLFVYRPGSFPDTKQYIEIWTSECIKHGIPAPYVTAVLTRGATDPREFYMDAGVERVLHDWTGGAAPERKQELAPFNTFNGTVLNYDDVANFYMDQDSSRDFTYFRSLIPIWDNTARYDDNAYVVHKSTPYMFQQWLEETIEYSLSELPREKRFIVVNAWNEWAEGAHLEPDTMFGYSYLNSIGRALSEIPYGSDEKLVADISPDLQLHCVFSSKVLEAMSDDEDLKNIFMRNISSSSIADKVSISSNCPSLFRAKLAEDTFDYLLEINDFCFVAPTALEKMLLSAIESEGATVIPNDYGLDVALKVINNNNNIERFWAHNAPMMLSPSSVTSRGYERFKICPEADCFRTTQLSNNSILLPEVTTIIRFHKAGDFNELVNALLCLQAMQDCIVTPLIAAQDLSDSQTQKLDSILDKLLWRNNIAPRVIHFDSPNGLSDLRSQMLNESLLLIETQYAAFLDYDDRLMPHAYSWLIERLKTTEKAVSYGRVYRTDFSSRTGKLLQRNKTFEYGSTYEDFLERNHAPLHSFMLDLTRLNLQDIEYVNEQKYMEDYYLMLQLVSQENADWEGLRTNVYIGDYMHSVDRLHTLAFSSEAAKDEVIADPVYHKAESLINNLKQKIALSNAKQEMTSALK